MEELKFTETSKEDIKKLFISKLMVQLVLCGKTEMQAKNMAFETANILENNKLPFPEINVG